MQALCAEETAEPGFPFWPEQPEDRTRCGRPATTTTTPPWPTHRPRRHEYRRLRADLELATCILETEARYQRTGLLAPIAGHVGDAGASISASCRIRMTPRRFSGLRAWPGAPGSVHPIRRYLHGEHGIGLHRRELLDVSTGRRWT